MNTQFSRILFGIFFLAVMFPLTAQDFGTEIKNLLSEDTITLLDAIYSNSEQIEDDYIDDSLFYNDELFFHTIIRLKPDKGYFIFTENAPIQIDSAFSPLNKSNRELYYKKALQAIDKADLRVHEKVWNLPEMQYKGGNGGYCTIVTWIDGYPTPDDPYYSVAIKHNMVTHLAAGNPSWVKVKKDLSKVLFMNYDGEYLTPSKWKKEKKKRE
jgi:hypothetical protein